MKVKMKLHKLLSMLLCFVMLVGLLPSTAYASKPGDSASNPVICTSFAEFKAAMEDTTVTYVKLNGASGLMPSQDSLAAAISNTTYKVLTIEGTNSFWSDTNGMNDSLIWPRADFEINGTGKLEYLHGNTGGTGAVINMTSEGVILTINGTVKLQGGANGNTFGYAIFAQAGTTNINGGEFIGYNAMIDNTAAMSAVTISSSANVTINDGEFSASLHPSSPVGKKAHSLSITSTATGNISIKAGTFPQGINIDATGKTIETCGYFDTEKVSITAGGNPVEATASTGVLESTEVIVTDTSVIGNVTVAVTTPVAGAAPAVPSSDTANVTVSNHMWTKQPEGTGITSFEAGKTYRCQVLLNPSSGYTFKSGATVTIGGQTATIDSWSATEIKAHYDFTTPAVPVSSVAISVTAPAAGNKPSAPTTSTANVNIVSYQWKTSGGTDLDPSTAFEAGKTYRLEMTIHPTGGQTLSTTATATVNGNAATVLDQSTSYLNCYYEFTIPAAVVPVSSVAISVTAPAAGATPSAPTTSTANVSIVGYQWKISGGSNLDSSTAFEAGKTYRLEMTINPTSGQTLSNTATATVNGNAATGMDQSTSYLNCYYDFTVESTINTIAVTVTAPVAGTAPVVAPAGLPAGVTCEPVSSPATGWYDEMGNKMASTDKFVEGKTYSIKLLLSADTGYAFANPVTTATINGDAADIQLNSDRYLGIKKSFVASGITTYTVSFDANGGTGTMADVTGVSGNYTLPENGFNEPTNQKFKGWATSATGSVIDGTTIVVEANTTLYAIWENKEYEIAEAEVKVTAPLKGAAPAATGTVSDGRYYVATIDWDPADTAFEAGTAYTVKLDLETSSGYEFTSGTVFKINGNNATVIYRGAEQATISYTFPTTTSESCSHKKLELVKKAATCTGYGTLAHYECVECGQWFEDITGIFVIPEEEKEDYLVDPTGHSFDSEGVCKDCGYKKPSTEIDDDSSDSKREKRSYSNRWVQDARGWWYRNPNGTWPSNGWAYLPWNGSSYWYYFDADGYMVTSWLDWQGNRYYLNPVPGTNSGKMLTGWQLIDGKWYYFNTEKTALEGAMLRSTMTPDGYQVGADGVWIP